MTENRHETKRSKCKGCETISPENFLKDGYCWYCQEIMKPERQFIPERIKPKTIVYLPEEKIKMEEKSQRYGIVKEAIDKVNPNDKKR